MLFEIRQLKYADLSNPGNYNKYKYCYIIFSVKYIHFDSILIVWNYVYNYSFLNDNLVLVLKIDILESFYKIINNNDTIYSN